MRAFVAAALLLAGCNPYDDGYGAAPFLCGAVEPRCPHGYTCLEENGRDVCFEDGSQSSDGNCSDDGALEPNNTLDTSTPTPLDTMRTFTHGGSAICPGIDRDNYAVTLSTTNESIEVVVDVQPVTTPIRAAIINAAGIPITAAAPVDGRLRAVAANLPAGTYHVLVAGNGESLSTHSYEVTIDVTGP